MLPLCHTGPFMWEGGGGGVCAPVHVSMCMFWLQLNPRDAQCRFVNTGVFSLVYARPERVCVFTAITHTVVIFSSRSQGQCALDHNHLSERHNSNFCHSISTRHSHDGLRVPSAEVMTNSRGKSFYCKRCQQRVAIFKPSQILWCESLR